MPTSFLVVKANADSDSISIIGDGDAMLEGQEFTAVNALDDW